MFFFKHKTKGLEIYSYMIGDSASKLACVIDPTIEIDSFIQEAEKNNFQIKYILETHVHADFVSGSLELKKRLLDKPKILCSKMGGNQWIPSYANIHIKDGDDITLGNIKLEALHTPGHTPEHLMWVLYDPGSAPMIFTGDCLFVGGIGRPDLLGKEAFKTLSYQLYDTIFEKLNQLPNDAKVYPAHGSGSLCGSFSGARESSTLGVERQTNPALKKEEKEKWIAKLMEDMPLAPPYFLRMKKVNIQGYDLKKNILENIKPLKANEIQKDAYQIVDVRPLESFLECHIKGAINIPYSPYIASWAGWVLDDKKPIALIYEKDNELDEAIKQLISIGFNHIAGYLLADKQILENEATETDHIETLMPQELYSMNREGKTTIIDVRTKKEQEGGIIDGALPIYFGDLPNKYRDIPKDKPIAVICQMGQRASIAASYLKQKQPLAIYHVTGGMSLWTQSKLPLKEK